MKGYFAYARVSTARQGEGVSLSEQQAAIERYAKDRGLVIAEWFTETETAAKRGGRKVFREILSRLRKREALGLVIHKIDRSARNLRDWADLGELIDTGIDVRFAHDNLDLESRGGRLAADIQAVIAADYIRNLREEVKKGIVGRLKQGLWPGRAPIGYLDRGGGKVKVPDPVKAPLIVQAFELYAGGTYTLRSLQAEMDVRGLRNHANRQITINDLSRILHNPFYMGILRFRTGPETYLGIHEPLVSRSMFEAVDLIRRGRKPVMRLRHAFTYRGLIRCELCDRQLVGERKKERYIYYRCHGQGCNACIREEAVEAAIENACGPVYLGSESELATLLAPLRAHWRHQTLAAIAPFVRRSIPALERAPTVQYASTRNAQSFLALARDSRSVFQLAPAILRRELTHTAVLAIRARQKDLTVLKRDLFQIEETSPRS